jgi:hypothetical protein
MTRRKDFSVARPPPQSRGRRGNCAGHVHPGAPRPQDLSG